MMRFWCPRLLGVLGLAFQLAACGGGGNFEPASQAQISALKAAAAAPPGLLAGEKLHVVVDDEPTLTGDFTIDPGGNLSMPVVGTMKVAGMRPAQLRDKLVLALR